MIGSCRIRPGHTVVGKVGEKVKDFGCGDAGNKIQIDRTNVYGLQVGVNGHLCAHKLHKAQKHPKIQIILPNRQRRLTFDVFVVA